MSITLSLPMDYLLGSVIDDYRLYKIFEGGIIILSLVNIFLFIQIALVWKQMKSANIKEVISPRDSFILSIIFIAITAVFMLLHELLEGIEGFAPDATSFEFLELLAVLGLVLFFYEWYKILNKQKKAFKANYKRI